VSDIQRKQMVTQHGANVGVFGVRGNFDDCQTAVKAAFTDRVAGNAGGVFSRRVNVPG